MGCVGARMANNPSRVPLTYGNLRACGPPPWQRGTKGRVTSGEGVVTDRTTTFWEM